MSKVTQDIVKRWHKWIDDEKYDSLGKLARAAKFSKQTVRLHLERYDEKRATNYFERLTEASDKGTYPSKQMPQTIKDTEPPPTPAPLEPSPTPAPRPPQTPAPLEPPVEGIVEEFTDEDFIEKESLRLKESLSKSHVPFGSVIINEFWKADPPDLRSDPAWLNIIMREVGTRASNREMTMKMFFDKRIDDWNAIDNTTLEELYRKHGKEPQILRIDPERLRKNPNRRAKGQPMEDPLKDVQVRRASTAARMDELKEVEHVRRMQEMGSGGGAMQKTLLDLALNKPTLVDELTKFASLKDLLNPKASESELEQRRYDRERQDKADAELKIQMEKLRIQAETRTQETQQMQFQMMQKEMDDTRNQMQAILSQPTDIEKYLNLEEKMKAQGVVRRDETPDIAMQRQYIDRLDRQLQGMRLEMAEMGKHIVFPMAQLQMEDMRLSMLAKHGLSPDQMMEVERERRERDTERMWSEVEDARDERLPPTPEQSDPPPPTESEPTPDEVTIALNQRTDEIKQAQEQVLQAREELEGYRAKLITAEQIQEKDRKRLSEMSNEVQSQMAEVANERKRLARDRVAMEESEVVEVDYSFTDAVQEEVDESLEDEEVEDYGEEERPRPPEAYPRLSTADDPEEEEDGE